LRNLWLQLLPLFELAVESELAKYIVAVAVGTMRNGQWITTNSDDVRIQVEVSTTR